MQGFYAQLFTKHRLSSGGQRVKAYFRRALNLDCQAIRVAQSNRESLTGLGPRLKGSAELFEKKMPCNFNRLLKVVTIFPLARRT